MAFGYPDERNMIKKGIEVITSPLIVLITIVLPAVILFIPLAIVIHFGFLAEFIFVLFILTILWLGLLTHRKNKTQQTYTENDARLLEEFVESDRLHIDQKTDFLANRFHSWM